MESQQLVKNAISLKGSVDIISDYLRYSVNSILYQRGIYPQESFKVQQQYDIPLFVNEDVEIKKFITNLLIQIEEWILKKQARKLSLIIINVETKETIECWDFILEYEAGDAELTKQNKQVTGNKDIKKIQKEIREVMRQISATVTYLPLLDCRCSFDILIHTVDCDEIPDKWGEAQPIHIANSQNVQLKSFSTSLHKMETIVNYKLED